MLFPGWLPKGNERTFWWKRVIAFRQFLRTSPSSNYSWTSSPVIDFKTKHNLLSHIFPPSCCCWPSSSSSSRGSCMATMMFSNRSPSPQLLCHCTSFPPAGGWRGSGLSCHSGPCSSAPYWPYIDALQLFPNPALDFDPLPFLFPSFRSSFEPSVPRGHLRPGGGLYLRL